jgi:hypothetical protein
MTSLDNVIPFLAGLVLAAWKAQEQTRDLQGRTVCLRAVNQMTNQFYDLAERLLNDPAMPDTLKNAIYDMTFAVTNEAAGRKSVDVILESLTSNKSSLSGSSGSLESGLAALRKEDRSDLYDDFHTAIRTAIMALVLSYGPDHSKVVFEVEATRNTSVMLAITTKLVAVLSDWFGGDGGPQKVAA